MSSVQEDEVRDPPGADPSQVFDRSAEDDRPSRRLLVLSAWGAAVGFTAVGIGLPLVGVGVFAPTDLLANWSPYGETVLAGVEAGNPFRQDVVDGVLPQTMLFVDRLSAWNPFQLGGVPLGAVPNNALFNPLSLPFYLLPAWFAPAWVKALEIGVSVGGTFLFARRLGLGRPAAVTGGLAFATSAFMLAWTGWPQTRTAAFIPVLFWAVERLVARRRVGDAVLVCLAAAAMLLGGFPAVTGYALAAAGVYLVVRLLAEYRGEWGRVARVAAGGVAAVAGAVGLAAVQLLPFAYFLSHSYVWGREQAPTDHLPFQALVTSIAPWSLGSSFAGTNIVEALSYVGAATLLLALVGVAAGRALLPRGVAVYLVAVAGVMVVLVYAGGPPLALAQRLPVLFADNFVGRLRSVLGFLVAVLAAVGFEAVLRRRAAGRAWGTGVWVVAGAGAVAVGAGLVGVAARPDPGAVLVGLAFTAAAGGLLALAWWGRRTVALAGIPVLVALQALTFTGSYWASADRATFYPETDTHRFLAGHLGADRYASPTDTLVPGESSVHRLRSLNGHAFSDERMGELVEALPGRQFRDPPSLPSTVATAPVVTSPVLDRLAVRYFVAAPTWPVIGTRGPATELTLAANTPVTVPLAGPPRAIVVEPAAATELAVSLRDAAGTEVAGRTLTSAAPHQVPVAERGPLTATLTARDDVRVTLSAVLPADDGLRVVLAEPSVVYERERALPRIRWAGTETAEPDPGRRLTLITRGDLAPHEVLLDTPADPRADGSSGSAAEVEIVEDSADTIEVDVAATGAGHLVVADALQHGWRATVDGRPAELVPADHALVATAVDAGSHTVRLTYDTPFHGAGTWLTATTGAGLCALVIADRWWRRRHRAIPRIDAHPGNRD